MAATKLQRLSVTRALQRYFSHFENYVLVDVNQMYPTECLGCSFIFNWLFDKQKLRIKTYKIFEAPFGSSPQGQCFEAANIQCTTTI